MQVQNELAESPPMVMTWSRLPCVSATIAVMSFVVLAIGNSSSGFLANRTAPLVSSITKADSAHSTGGGWSVSRVTGVYDGEAVGRVNAPEPPENTPILPASAFSQ